MYAFKYLLHSLAQSKCSTIIGFYFGTPSCQMKAQREGKFPRAAELACIKETGCKKEN